MMEAFVPMQQSNFLAPSLANGASFSPSAAAFDLLPLTDELQSPDAPGASSPTILGVAALCGALVASSRRGRQRKARTAASSAANAASAGPTVVEMKAAEGGSAEVAAQSGAALDLGMGGSLVMRPAATFRKTGILIMNIGTPNSLKEEDVRSYLAKFLGDDRVVEIKPAFLKWAILQVLLASRPRDAKEAYATIWDEERGSPLLYHSKDLVKGLQAELGDKFVVKLGFQYSDPMVTDVMEQFRADGVDNIMLVPAFPQYASSTTGGCLQLGYEIASKLYCTPNITALGAFYDHPAWIQSMKTEIEKSVGERAKDVDHFLFSFHGVPEAQCEQTDDSGEYCLKNPDCCSTLQLENRNCYRAQCYDTARLLAKACDLPEGKWSVSFQSRLTLRNTIEWIKPYTDEAFAALAKRGVRRLGVVAPAFTADCVETLEELGQQGQEQFAEEGGQELVVVPCLNASETWIKGFATIIKERAGVLPGEAGPPVASAAVPAPA